ncbi:MAG: DUF5107 domain-containing protein [Anaerolineae bacterium]
MNLSAFPIPVILTLLLLLCTSCAGVYSPTPAALASPVGMPATAATPVPTPSSTRPASTPWPTVTPTRRPSPSMTATSPPTSTAVPTPTSSPTHKPSASPSPPPLPAVQVHRATITIPTYPYQDFLRQELSSPYHMPIWRLDWGAYEASAPQPAPHEYQAIVMENDHLRLTILPELGGRIYECTLKSSGRNLLYQNPVLKPTRWGPPEQGWWLAAGGIEFCLPVEEHGYESATAWKAEVHATPRQAVVRLRDSTDPSRLQAQIDVILRAGEARFTLHTTLINGSRDALPVTFWNNAMLAPGGTNAVSPGVEFILPAHEVVIHSTNDPRLPGAGQTISWPSWQGVDWRYPVNWQGWLGVFAWPKAQFGFAGVYDHTADEGLVRAFDPDQAGGVKAFGFGPPAHSLPSSLWTDGTSRYVELHGGLQPTFSDAHILAAGARLEWEEWWFPLQGMGGLSAAGPSGALSLHWQAESRQLWVRLWPARPLRGQVVMELAGREAGAISLDQPAGAAVEARFPWDAQPPAGAPLSVVVKGEGGTEEAWSGYFLP